MAGLKSVVFPIVLNKAIPGTTKNLSLESFLISKTGIAGLIAVDSGVCSVESLTAVIDWLAVFSELFSVFSESPFGLFSLFIAGVDSTVFFSEMVSPSGLLFS